MSYFECFSIAVLTIYCFVLCEIVYCCTLMKTRTAAHSGFAKAHACFDLPEYWMSAICISKLWNTAFCPGLYHKNSASEYCFTSDVMYKKYERLVHTPLDLLVRFCNATLSNAKKFGLICFPGLIYCDQEPLWLLIVIEDDCFIWVYI